MNGAEWSLEPFRWSLKDAIGVAFVQVLAFVPLVFMATRVVL